MWVDHPSFMELVEELWSMEISRNPQFVLHKKLKTLRGRLKSWNKEVFGDLKASISTVEANIQFFQDSMDNNPSNPTLNDLNSAKASLHNLLVEEKHWRQKSRIKWLVDGDQNTKFFNISTKIRNSSNAIDRIPVNDYLLSKKEDIQEIVVAHFSKAFNPHPYTMHKYLLQCDHLSISPSYNSVTPEISLT